MKIKIKDIRIYYLTTEKRSDRNEHMQKLLQECPNVKKIIGPQKKYIQKNILGSLGHISVIQNAILESWEPFLLLEDDCEFSSSNEKNDRLIDVELDMPDNTDALFVGISKCGSKPNKNEFCFDVLANNTENKNIIRIYNMLSTHAILFVSKKYMLSYMQSMMECATISSNTVKDIGWDCILSRLYPYFNIYALRYPLFYQSIKFGGQEEPTRIIFPLKYKESNEREAKEYHSFYTEKYGVTSLLYIKN